MLFLGPILAQVAALTLADRTEARYVVSDDKHYEAVTRPLLGLNSNWRHFTLSLGYSPSLTVIPLESKPRDYLVFQTGFVSGAYAWERSVLTVSEAVGYGAQNFQSVALADPRAPVAAVATPAVPASPTAPAPSTGNTGNTGTPGAGATGAAAQLRASRGVVHFVTSTSTVALDRRTSNQVSLHTEFSYLVAGATRHADERNYPLITAPRGLVSARYRLGHSDDFTAALSLQYATSQVGNSVWIGTTSGTWTHKFNANTSAALGLGVSGTKTPLPLDFVQYGIYPVATASVTNSSRLAHGQLGLSLAVASSPVIDLVTAVVDPRIGSTAVTTWQRDRFTASVSAGSAISTSAHTNLGALSSVGAAAGVAYRLSNPISVDGGARMAYQSYAGVTQIPVSYAVFLGVSVGFSTPL